MNILVRTRYLCIVFVAFACVATTYAQSTFSIHPEFKSEKLKEVDGLTILNNPADVTLSFELNDSKCIGIDEVGSFVVFSNGQSFGTVYQNVDDLSSMKYNPTLPMKGDYTFYATIKYRRENAAGTNEVVQELTTDSIRVKIVDKVVCQASSDCNFSFYAEGNVSLAASVTGGIEDGWTYSWYKDGLLIPNATSLDYKEILTNNSGKTQSHSYRFVGENSFGNEIWETVEQDYNVKINAKANIVDAQSSEAVRIGDRISAYISLEGGIEGAWGYKWYFDNEEIVNETSHSISYLVDNDKFVGEKHSLKVVAINYDGDRVVDTLEKTFEFMVVPDFEEVELPKDFSVNSGDDVTLNIDVGSSSVYSIKYQWFKNGCEIDGATSSTYRFVAENNMLTDLIDTYSVSITAIYNGNEIYSKDYSCQVTVFPAPRVTSSSPIEDVVSVSGRIVTYSVDVGGGDPKGWSYQWYKDDVLIPNESSSSYSCFLSNLGTDCENTIYKVIVTNTIDGMERFKSEIPFKTQIWPTPTVDVDKELEFFYGESATIEAIAKGGYPGKWSYSWTSSFGKSDISSYSFNVSSSDKESYGGTIYLTVKNSYQTDGDWYSNTFEIPYRAWALPEVEAKGPSRNDYCEGQRIDASVKISKGNTKGWSFDWKDEGKTICKESVLDYTAEFNGNGGLEYEEHKITLVATNKVTKQKISEIFDYVVRIWRKPEFPQSISIIDKNRNSTVCVSGIREGNEMHIYVDSPRYGYTLGTPWAYNWTSNEMNIGDNRDLGTKVVKMNSSGNNMYTENINYSLSMQNIGPDGSEWGTDNISKSITVYRRPLTPTALKIKGKTSRILVAAMPISDNVVLDCEYYLVFGSTGHSEYVVEQNGRAEKYFQFPASEFDINNDFYVYSLWKYKDGAVVTSGKRYLDRSDEFWDGSDFSEVSETRAMENEIHTAIIDNTIDHEDIPMEIFDSHGRKLDNMQKGINIVRYSNGIVRKVYNQ